MPDLFADLPADVASAFAAPLIEQKQLLELALDWPGALTGAEARAARRLRVFVLTWDPFDWLDGRGPAFATATGAGGTEELLLYVPLWGLANLAEQHGLTVAATLGRLAESVVRVGAEHEPLVVSGSYAQRAHERTAPRLLPGWPETSTLPCPTVTASEAGWESIGLGAIQDLVADVFGPVDLDRRPVALTPHLLAEPSCPACAGKRFGFPAELHEAVDDMCGLHHDEALEVVTARLDRAKQSNPEGWEAICAASTARQRPHLPGGLRQRLLDAARNQKPEPERLGGHARLVLELVRMFDDRPDEFAEAIADPTSWELEAWLECLPANLGNVGLVEEAVALGDALAALDPHNAAMYAGDVAFALAEAGQVGEAEVRFAAALEAHPDDEWVRIKAARVRMAAGDLDGAERHLRDAVEVSRRATSPYKTDDASDELAEFLEQHGPPGGGRRCPSGTGGLAGRAHQRPHGARDDPPRRSEGWPQRPVPLRQRAQAQTLLRRLSAP